MEHKRFLKIIDIVNYALKYGRHMCVCSLSWLMYICDNIHAPTLAYIYLALGPALSLRITILLGNIIVRSKLHATQGSLVLINSRNGLGMACRLQCFYSKYE